jgi:hypothetical protein
MEYVHDVRTVNALFDLGYDEDALVSAGPVPAYVPEFMTFFDPGWDIIRLCRYSRDKNLRCFDEHRHDGMCYAEVQEGPCYRRMRRESIPGTHDKPFELQMALIPQGEEHFISRRMVMGLVVHFLTTGERLYETDYVFGSEAVSESRVIIGGFDTRGLYLGFNWAKGKLPHRALTSFLATV